MNGETLLLQPTLYTNLHNINTMKKYISVFILVGLLFCSCDNKKNQITIQGDLRHAHGQLIKLAMVTSNGLAMIDSVELKDGHFEFSVKGDSKETENRMDSPMMYQIMLTPDNMITTIAQKGDHLTIQGDTRDLLKTYRIQGGDEAQLMWQLDSSLNTFVLPVDQMFAVYQKNIDNDSVRADIEQKYLVLLQQHTAFLTDFIQKHPQNIASYIAFYQSYNRRCFFDENTNLPLLKKITQNLKKKYPYNEYVINMQQRVDALETAQKERKQQYDTH